MLGNRDELCKDLELQFRIFIQNKEVEEKVKENKDFIPMEVAVDYMTLHNHLQDCDDRLLFCFTKFYKLDSLEKYFTSNEIKKYNKPYKIDKFKLPVHWNMIKVADDQWIGKIDVKELMKLRDAQMINYNTETQRPASIKNGIERIDIVRKSINKIMELYKMGSYIPNAITLNMPEDAEYYYDENENDLVITNIDMFDILDGYHRYIAISNMYNLDSNFTYEMEFRVAAFSESKARQFVWQENQKNKIKKIAVESYNQNDYGVQVVQILNQEPMLRGTFSSVGIVNNIMASRMINLLAFNKINHKITRGDLIDVKDYILAKFNTLLKLDKNILDTKWDNQFIIVAFYVFYMDNVADEELLNKINELLNNSNIKPYLINSFDKKMLNKVNKEVGVC